jgi:hypothetical protein
MVELSDFVSQTLVQIVRAVEKAQKELADSTASVNPGGVLWQDGIGRSNNATVDTHAIVQQVGFDVAVTAKSHKTGSGKGGVNVSVLSIGAEGKAIAIQGQESRIRFSVPLRLPAGPAALNPPPPPRLTARQLAERAGS